MTGEKPVRPRLGYGLGAAGVLGPDRHVARARVACPL